MCFKEFINEEVKLELLKTPTDQAYQYAKSKIDVDELIPDFQKNYKLAQTLAKKGHTKRKDMPVIGSKDLDGYKKFLKEKNIKFTETKISVKDLNPIQSQIYFNKSMGSIVEFGIDKTEDFLDTKTTIVSSDNFIIDGHHRYLTALLISPSFKFNCIKVGLPLKELLKISLEYADSIGNQRNESFLEFLIEQGLRIVKKRVDLSSKDLAKYDTKLNREKEPQEFDNHVGNVQGYDVILTHHVFDKRDYEQKPRNYGLEKKDYIRVIDMFLKKRKPQEDKRYHLFFKDKKGTYSNLVVQVRGNEIVVVTVMQMKKRDVGMYFSKPGELRLKLESTDVFILLDLEI